MQASTEHLPQTVSLQYHFMPDSKFQPYLGLGVNYSHFFSEKTTGPLEGTDLDGADLGKVEINPWVYSGNVGFRF